MVPLKLADLGLGWTHANQNRHEEAIADYDRILRREPDALPALLGKGNSLSGLHRIDEAEKIFQAILDRHPDNAYALAEMGLIHYNKGEDALAEESFRAALAQDDKKIHMPL
ncbi:MAG: tetratricopeptide repeat protein [Deltaproteobacteria bacterium]|nr:tetratricopeptide repeat protein [Deltaproteobacteria bacterium]